MACRSGRDVARTRRQATKPEPCSPTSLGEQPGLRGAVARRQPPGAGAGLVDDHAEHRVAGGRRGYVRSPAVQQAAPPDVTRAAYDDGRDGALAEVRGAVPRVDVRRREL